MISLSDRHAGGPVLDLSAGRHLAPLARALVAEGREELLAPLRLVPLPLPAAGLDPPAEVDRGEIARALADSNRALGHPRAARLAELLAQPSTRVVVTGQQPGLFGGPLYGLSKAVAASKVAAALEASGRPAVAVFWVATEDHDYAEVAAATFSTPEVREVCLGPDRAPLLPVGRRPLGAAVSRCLDELLACSADPYRGGLEELSAWYRPEATFGEAFARLLIHVLGEQAPLVLDALDPTLKRLERPFLRRFVVRRAEVDRALSAAEARIEKAGFTLQVRRPPCSSPLFLLGDDGARRCIEWPEPDRFRRRGTESAGGENELLACVDQDLVSPGALARPAVQDGVLGTTLQILGPGEMAYMTQAAALYDVAEVAAPATTLRPQIGVVDARSLEHLDWLAARGVDLARLLGPEQELERALAAHAGADFVRPLATEIDRLVASLAAPAMDLDTQLERPFDKTRDQVAKALELFATKVDAAAARRDEVLRRRLAGLRDLLLPGGRLQERVLSAGHFLARFGAALGPGLLAGMRLDSRVLQILCPDEHAPPASRGAGR